MITFTAICLGLLSLMMAQANFKNATTAAVIGYYWIAITPALVGAAMIYGAYR